LSEKQNMSVSEKALVIALDSFQDSNVVREALLSKYYGSPANSAERVEEAKPITTIAPILVPAVSNRTAGSI